MDSKNEALKYHEEGRPGKIEVTLIPPGWRSPAWQSRIIRQTLTVIRRRAIWWL